MSKCSMHFESCSHECPPHRSGHPSEKSAESSRVNDTGPSMLTNETWLRKHSERNKLTRHLDLLLSDEVGQVVQLVVHVEVADASGKAAATESIVKKIMVGFGTM